MSLLSDQGPSQPISILLVEDDAPTLWRLQDALAKAGFQVTSAATLAEARASLAQAGPRVLLTDLQLPDGHGNELIRETRQRFPDTEIMVISILGDEESVIAAITGLRLAAIPSGIPIKAAANSERPTNCRCFNT